MDKAQLRSAYIKAREEYVSGGFTNEYALKLDTMLSEYFRLLLIDPAEDDPDLVS